MHSLFVHKFSTTSPQIETVYEATLMSAMQNYFSYKVTTMCGIKKVRLLGTQEDWQTIREKAASLAKYGLEWWI